MLVRPRDSGRLVMTVAMIARAHRYAMHPEPRLSGFRAASLVLVCALTLTACNDGDANGAMSREDSGRATMISTVPARVQGVEVTERTIGRIASRTAPVLTAEVSGRITEILVDAGDSVDQDDVLLRLDAEPYELGVATARAEIARLTATLRNRERELTRHADLLRDGAINQAAFDATEAEVQALQAQVEGARTQLRLSERNVELAEYRAPIRGTIDERFVSVGDFLPSGARLFRLVGDDLLRVLLPFPETLADRLSVGQTVRLQRPGAWANSAVESRISDLRPALVAGSRTMEAMVDLENPGGWLPGGSIAATVVVEHRAGIVVPTRSVVQRPAGEVVYVVENGSVVARNVEVGWRGSELSEIVAGLSAGEHVAADGAGFLTDGAAVRIASD
jgi:RND family efflux transporter MFP subunit